MGGTIGYTDNTPHGTVMLLRVPKQHPQCQQQAHSSKLDSPTPTGTDSISSTSTDSTSSSSSSGSGDSSMSREKSSSSSSVEKAAAASNEHALNSKRILVSSMSVNCITCVHMLVQLLQPTSRCAHSGSSTSELAVVSKILKQRECQCCCWPD
jgi:hypothetical protein